MSEVVAVMEVTRPCDVCGKSYQSMVTAASPVTVQDMASILADAPCPDGHEQGAS